jgi:L-asparaginase II
MTFMRSAVKPFQAYPLVHSGAADHFGLSEKELAICCASHNSENVHIETVNALLTRTGLSESDLHCGSHKPIDEETADTYLKNRINLNQLHNNCSGKHTGMLLTCRYLEYPLENYIDQDHPLQKDITRYISTQIHRNNIYTGIDGCSVPTFYLSLTELATLFQRLAEKQDETLTRIREAMTSEPYMVAGQNRFDTKIMEYGTGTIVAKVGAEGLRGVGFELNGEAYGLALKVVDGAKRASASAALEILRRFQVLNPLGEETLMPYYRPVIKNHRGIEVGHIEPHIIE